MANSSSVPPRAAGASTGIPTRRQYVAAVPPRLATASRHAGLSPSTAGSMTRNINGIWKKSVDRHDPPEAGDEPDRKVDAGRGDDLRGQSLRSECGDEGERQDDAAHVGGEPGERRDRRAQPAWPLEADDDQGEQ